MADIPAALPDSPELPAETACGGQVKEPSKYLCAEFQGRIVYFCSEACRRAFRSNPEGFMAGEIEHPLD